MARFNRILAAALALWVAGPLGTMAASLPPVGVGQPNGAAARDSAGRIIVGSPTASGTAATRAYSNGDGLALPDSTDSTTNGGTAANHGDRSFGAGAYHFTGPDGTEQFRVVTSPGAVDFAQPIAGQAGVGAGLGCFSATDVKVDCVIAAQGAGLVYLGNGSGVALQTVDPGGPAAFPLLVTPGLAGGQPKIGSTGGVQVDAASGSAVLFTVNGVVAGKARNTTNAVTGTAWVEFAPSDSSLARLLCSGPVNTSNYSCYIQAANTGSVILANAQGSLVTFSNSSANTDYDYPIFKSAATNTPVLWQSGNNLSKVRIGGSGGTASALPITATVGFPGIPTVPGRPTGMPVQAGTGTAYLVYDTADDVMCAFVTVWKCSPTYQ